MDEPAQVKRLLSCWSVHDRCVLRAIARVRVLGSLQPRGIISEAGQAAVPGEALEVVSRRRRQRHDHDGLIDVAPGSRFQRRLRVRRPAVRRKHSLLGPRSRRRGVAQGRHLAYRGGNRGLLQGQRARRLRRVDAPLLRRVLPGTEAGPVDDGGVLEQLQRRVASHSGRSGVGRASWWPTRGCSTRTSSRTGRSPRTTP